VGVAAAAAAAVFAAVAAYRVGKVDGHLRVEVLKDIVSLVVLTEQANDNDRLLVIIVHQHAVARAENRVNAPQLKGDKDDDDEEEHGEVKGNGEEEDDDKDKKKRDEKKERETEGL
jgi:hypothetical protein